MEWPPAVTWGSSLAYLSAPAPVPHTHVAIVDVEDMYFGRRLDFLYAGTVPAKTLQAELTGPASRVRPPWSLREGRAASIAFPCSGLGVNTRGCHGQYSDQTPPKPMLGVLWPSPQKIRAELGAEGGSREHVEQINVSLGHKATRLMTRLMSAV